MFQYVFWLMEWSYERALFNYWIFEEGIINKQKALRIVNPIMFFLVFYQGVTGFFREQMYAHFKAVHPIAGGLLLLFAVLHLSLNWGWVKSQYKPRKKK